MIGPCRAAYRENRFNSRVAGPLKHGVAVFVELRVLKVRMGVDDLQGRVQ
jgi:hypothetical protein